MEGREGKLGWRDGPVLWSLAPTPVSLTRCGSFTLQVSKAGGEGAAAQKVKAPAFPPIPGKPEGGSACILASYVTVTVVLTKVSPLPGLLCHQSSLGISPETLAAVLWGRCCWPIFQNRR